MTETIKQPRGRPVIFTDEERRLKVNQFATNWKLAHPEKSIETNQNSKIKHADKINVRIKETQQVVRFIKEKNKINNTNESVYVNTTIVNKIKNTVEFIEFNNRPIVELIRTKKQQYYHDWYLKRKALANQKKEDAKTQLENQ